MSSSLLRRFEGTAGLAGCMFITGTVYPPALVAFMFVFLFGILMIDLARYDSDEVSWRQCLWFWRCWKKEKFSGSKDILKHLESGAHLGTTHCE